MYRLKSSLFLLFILLCSLPFFVHAQNDSAKTRSEKIYYFIDTDCDRCSVSDHKDSKIWIATNSTYAAKMDDHDMLLKKFKAILNDKYKADSVVISRAVFRYQDSEKQADESYNAKEMKMKGRGYMVVKIEF